MPFTKIIAHRGAWKEDDLPPNSLAALRNAQKLQCDLCELDVHQSRDGVVVVNHDADFLGMPIEQSSYAQLCTLKHPNGDTIPTLDEFLAASPMPLALEIKASPQGLPQTLELTEAVLQCVEEHQAQNRIHYISFQEEVLKKVLLREPNATVSLLNGKLNPQQLKAAGFAGLDYHYKVLLDNPSWIGKAHELDLLVNVWTVDEVDQMRWFMDAGVDFLTTDMPRRALGERGR